MLDRSWVQWCTFIGYLAAGAKSYRSSNPQITGDEILLKMSQTITEAIICFRSGQVPGPNASSEASGDDVDGEADASAENNDKASKGR